VLAFGGFLIVLGVVFGLTPGILQKIVEFFCDFTGQPYPVDQGTIVLPAPANPAVHMDVYGAVFNFMVGMGVLQVVILALRLIVYSPFRRIVETVGNLVLWWGGAVAVNVFLLTGTLVGWFNFWAVLIIFWGVSLVIRGIIHLIWSWRKHDFWR